MNSTSAERASAAFQRSRIGIYAQNGPFVVAIARISYPDRTIESATVLTLASPVLSNEVYTRFYLFTNDKSSEHIIQRFKDAGKVAPDATTVRIFCEMKTADTEDK
jgi:hypothetical protein